MEPECVRLRGELTLRGEPPDVEFAERLFKEAIAQAHGAKSWELRATMSLARLLLGRDRPADAVARAEPMLNWFTEGLETEDIRQAYSLLTALA
jgi:predicted ATPase